MFYCNLTELVRDLFVMKLIIYYVTKPAYNTYNGG